MRCILYIDKMSVNRYNIVMTFLDLLSEKKTTVYSLSLDSGVPKTTLTDIASGKADKGIVICFTGIGISIAANKVKGVRCALVNSVDAAILTREHNDSNCLAMGAKYTSNELAIQIVDTWLDTEFSNIEKHSRRINKITSYENEVE